MAVSGYEFVRHRVEREKIKFVSTNGREILFIIQTISWTNPSFPYAHSYLSQEIEKITSVHLYSECYCNKAYKILLLTMDHFPLKCKNNSSKKSGTDIMILKGIFRVFAQRNSEVLQYCGM